MKIFSRLALITLGLAVFTLSCAKRDIEDWAACEKSSVSFSEDVLPIFQRSCNGCHSKDRADPMGGGKFNVFETYGTIKGFINFGLILGNIKHNEGFEPMPKSADKLSDCEIAIIDKWVAAGMPNN